MRVWDLVRQLKKMPPSAEVFYVADPALVANIDPDNADLQEVTKVEKDPGGEVVIS